MQLRILIEEYEDFRLLLPEIIRKEVQGNIPADLEGDFYRLIYSSEKIEYYSMLDVPVELFEKYRNEKGLKEGDALIAAFAEFVKTDYYYSVFLVRFPLNKGGQRRLCFFPVRYNPLTPFFKGEF